MRWKRRYIDEKPMLYKPGPKKESPINPDEIKEELDLLKHGRKRTRGVGQIYQKVKERISRRDFQLYVNTARREYFREKRLTLKSITWHCPGLVWAVDDTFLGTERKNNRKLYLNTIFDVAGRFTLDSLLGYPVKGPCLAAHLKHLFDTHGPPLVFKRDNAGNLNHESVNQVLQEYHVITLNSPCYYPQYNGGIERNQREIKKWLRCIALGKWCSTFFLAKCVKLIIRLLNRTCRKVLNGLPPREVFHERRKTKIFTPRDRCAIIEEIGDLGASIYCSFIETNKDSFDKAKRLAVEVWLKKEKLITVSNGKKVLPYFSSNLSQL